MHLQPLSRLESPTTSMHLAPERSVPRFILWPYPPFYVFFLLFPLFHLVLIPTRIPILIILSRFDRRKGGQPFLEHPLRGSFPAFGQQCVPVSVEHV